MKKRLFAAALLACATSCLAQENVAHSSAVNDLARLSATSPETALPATATDAWPAAPVATSFSAPLAEASSFAAFAAPAPPRRVTYGSDDDYRWQLGFSYVYVHFSSTPISGVSLNGIHTSVTYAVNRWFGLEGAVTAAGSASTIFANEHVKFALYGGGPRFTYRSDHWQPWVHAIVGGSHLQPQTSMGGRNAIGFLAGGGYDYRYSPRISFRFQGDWVGTRYFGETQSNFQIVSGVVFHF
ncbi:MAG: hypothetical protein LAN61_01820 [Acidobacteriia bacterium]|nr:hypothetical protein [Terriglobia bacterium]